MNGVKAFDIPVDSMERAARFYQQVFGWQIRAVPGSGGNFHEACTTPVDKNGRPKVPGAINGGLFQRGTHDLEGTFLEIVVPSIDEFVKKIESAGGKVVKPKGPILDLAFFALVKDTEGNVLGLWEDVKKTS